MRAIVIAAAVLALSACGDKPKVVQTKYGPVLELRGIECPVKEVTGGCTMWPAAVVFVGIPDDNAASSHEYEHVAGMRHSQWVTKGDNVCAQVTIAGDTKWSVGDWICRTPRGNYVVGWIQTTGTPSPEWV